MRPVLFGLLFTAFTHAGAQSGVLVSPLPDGVDSRQALEAARRVLVARGWELVPEDRASVEGYKGNSGVRMFAGDRELRFTDLSLRPRGSNAREYRESGPQLAAIPQTEIDGLRADLVAAFAGKFAAVPGAAPGTLSVVLFDRIDPGLSSKTVMDAARRAFIGRRWNVTPEGEAVFVAQIKRFETDATLRVFFANGALHYADITNRYGEQRYRDKSRLPERWINNLRADIGNTLIAVPRREAARAAPVQQPATPGDATERLRKLKSMFESGLITQGEYDSKRAEILKGL